MDIKQFNTKERDIILKYKSIVNKNVEESFSKILEVLTNVSLVVGNMALFYIIASAFFKSKNIILAILMIITMLNIVVFSYSYIKDFKKNGNRR